MDKRLMDLLSEQDRNTIDANIAHLEQISDEIIYFHNSNRLNNMVYESFVPMRLKGMSQILKTVTDRFENSIEGKIGQGTDKEELQKCVDQLKELYLLVENLENMLNGFLYDNKESEGLVKATEAVRLYLKDSDNAND